MLGLKLNHVSKRDHMSKTRVLVIACRLDNSASVKWNRLGQTFHVIIKSKVTFEAPSFSLDSAFDIVPALILLRYKISKASRLIKRKKWQLQCFQAVERTLNPESLSLLMLASKLSLINTPRCISYLYWQVISRNRIYYKTKSGSLDAA